MPKGFFGKKAISTVVSILVVIVIVAAAGAVVYVALTSTTQSSKTNMRCVASSQSGTVFEINPHTLGVVATINTGSNQGALGMAYDSSNDDVYVSYSGYNQTHPVMGNLSVIHGETLVKPLKNIGLMPAGPVYDSDNHMIYVPIFHGLVAIDDIQNVVASNSTYDFAPTSATYSPYNSCLYVSEVGKIQAIPTNAS